ncbi:HD-GYP domain-containing protein [Silvimonas amylolytica]|uniref:Metal-dependent phosphohydrolase n=1 Tax=Silvimonas amylolytica TaxID=449663 RepID=A0ABQ2PKF0_9NEIS|nr:HD-GYP domain-containing protein [Silvimonas amylolytica]GGP25704.1 metal-dependent phosphohydrolase [Silvimonas amylolytica]
MNAQSTLFMSAAAAVNPGSRLKLADLMASLSYALDITEGQPEGHCVRCCWIGLNIARELGVSERDQWDLYYTLLLKDLGCSSNAARICELYLTDDLGFKQSFKLVGTGLPQILGFVFSHTGRNARWSSRLQAIMNVLKNGGDMAQELIQTRCDRGAEIARRLRFNEAVAGGIRALDEHWDGSGRPDRLAGKEIPLASRIALLAQVIDVFHFSAGRGAALNEVRARAGKWFDPELCRAFEAVAKDSLFWQMLESDQIAKAVMALEPAQFAVPVDEDYLDDIAEAFGEVVDSKSPFTAGHSQRVGLYTDAIAAALEIPEARRRWLRRAALLHDVGKLGVSNSILDKPGKLDEEEWEAIKLHASYTEAILSRIGSFRELARMAAAHHERLDGTGYPRGLKADAISLETRIVTTADIFDAISAERPYHPATSIDETLAIMKKSVGTAIDPRCFEALCRVAEVSVPA